MMPDPMIQYDEATRVITIVIDASEEAIAAAPLSKSGKTKLLVSTYGNARIGPVKVGLNAFVELKK